MITKVRVSNFYSIGEETEIFFTKGGSSDQKGYFQYKTNEKISLLNGFFGANASGKSTILKAIALIIRMIYNPQPTLGLSGEIVLCNPNFHKKFENLPTKLGIDFLFGNNYYSYDIEIKGGKEIVIEKLFITTLNIKSAKPKEIFTRNESEINFGPEYKNYKSYLDISKIQKHQTFISHLIINVGAKALIDFINNKSSFFLKTDEFDMAMPAPFVMMAKAMHINSLSKKEKDDFLEITKSVMSSFDKSIEKIEINNTNNNLNIEIKHKNFVSNVNLMQESAGSRELFSHIGDILNVIKKGGVVIYDETNRFYHPDVELSIISLFKNKTFNKNNSQIFFASHNHETFDLLELDQVFIVEKNNENTFAHKLSEISDLNKRDNLKKKYRLGILGGVPDVVDLDFKLKEFL